LDFGNLAIIGEFQCIRFIIFGLSTAVNKSTSQLIID
jgi:hypothetical protein